MSHDDPKPTPSATPQADRDQGAEAAEPARARLAFQTEPGVPVRPTMRRLLQGLVHYADRAADDLDALAHDDAHGTAQSDLARIPVDPHSKDEPGLALPHAWETVRESPSDEPHATHEIATAAGLSGARGPLRVADTIRISGAPSLANSSSPASERVSTLKDFTTASMIAGAPVVAESGALALGATRAQPASLDDLPPSTASLALRAKADAIMQGDAITAKPPHVAPKAAPPIALAVGLTGALTEASEVPPSGASSMAPVAASKRGTVAADRANSTTQEAGAPARRLIYGVAGAMLVALIVVLLLPTRYFGFGIADSLSAAPPATLELNGNMRIAPSAPSVPPKVPYVPSVSPTALATALATASVSPSATAPDAPTVASSARPSPVAPSSKPHGPTSASVYAPSGFVPQ